VTVSVLEPKRFAGNNISIRIYCHAKALWMQFWYDTELLSPDEVDEKRAVGLTGVVKINKVVNDGMACLALLRRTLRRRLGGKNCPPQTWIGPLLK